MKNIMETLEILSPWRLPWRNNQNLVQLVKAKLDLFGFG